MTHMPVERDALKQQVREALRAVLSEDRGWLQTLVAEVIEELAEEEAQRELDAIAKVARERMLGHLNARA